MVKQRQNASIGARARSTLRSAQREATPGRVAAIAALGLGAAAYRVFRNPDRRERLREQTQWLRDRAGRAWYGETESGQAGQSGKATAIAA